MLKGATNQPNCIRDLIKERFTPNVTRACLLEKECSHWFSNFLTNISTCLTSEACKSLMIQSDRVLLVELQSESEVKYSSIDSLSNGTTFFIGSYFLLQTVWKWSQVSRKWY